jgi:hypothetical protein
MLKNGRDDWIRTSDLTHPKRARYQAALRPDRIGPTGCRAEKQQIQRYHLPSSSVNKLRSASRKSSKVPRLSSSMDGSASLKRRGSARSGDREPFVVQQAADP